MNIQTQVPDTQLDNSIEAWVKFIFEQRVLNDVPHLSDLDFLGDSTNEEIHHFWDGIFEYIQNYLNEKLEPGSIDSKILRNIIILTCYAVYKNLITLRVPWFSGSNLLQVVKTLYNSGELNKLSVLDIFKKVSLDKEEQMFVNGAFAYLKGYLKAELSRQST
jgi:hypothetical protein